MCIPFLLLFALANCAHLLSTCLAGENGALYSEGRAYKRALKLVANPQSTALHPTGNISAEDSVYKNKVGHNSISNILCGLRLLIQVVYSKEKLSLAMSISTSNEHILDKTMVKICGLTICLRRVSVQWLLLTLFIILTSSNECMAYLTSVLNHYIYSNKTFIVL
jgi:hypothetical protein